MSAKRSLKLDNVKKYNPVEASPLAKKNLNYSPTTGTRQISPFSSPSSHNAEDLRNGLSHGDETNSESRLSRRGQPRTVEDAFAALQSNVKSSLVRILKTRENLTSLQALEGSRELENIIGVSDSSCVLSAEVQKTQVLMSQAEELQLLKRNHGQLPAREDIDYLCVVRDLENSIKGVVQRFHKFPRYSVYTDIEYAQPASSSAFLQLLLDSL